MDRYTNVTFQGERNSPRKIIKDYSVPEKIERGQQEAGKHTTPPGNVDNKYYADQCDG